MSLQVWLPLNGDLKNQGLRGDLDFTTTGTVSDGDGKIGKCKVFSSSNCIAPFTYTLGTEFTLCLWVNWTTFPSSSSNDWIFELGKTSGYENGVVGLSCYHGTLISVMAGGKYDYSLSHGFTTGVWHHIAFVWSSTEDALLYFDGELVKTYTNLKGGTVTSANKLSIGSNVANSSTKLKGKLNDIRLYDNCLSAKQIKEISKGLVLHYPLTGVLPTSQYDHQIYEEPDGSLWARIFHHNNPNGGLFSKTDTFSTGVYKDANRWYDVEGICAIINKFEFMVKQKTTSSATEVKYRWIQNKSPINSVWADVKASEVTRITTSGYTDGSQGGLYLNNGNTRLVIANANSGNWYGATGSWTVYNNGIPGYPNTVVTTGYMDIYIRIDNANFAGETIYDTSGYQYNGTKTGTFTYTTQTPKYEVSTDFTGANYIYLTSPLSEAKTLSLWANWDTIPSGQSVIFVDYKSKLGLGLMSTGILCGTSGPGDYYTFDKSNLVANTWYHFVVVNPGEVTGTSRKLYINGEEQTAKTTTSKWTYSVDQMQIGKRSTTSDGFVGKLSDLRIYATALSAEDVAELYSQNHLS